MNEDLTMNDPDDDLRQQIALFRYSVIADLVHLPVGAPGAGAMMRAKAEQTYSIPGTTRTRVAAETMRHWINDYRRGGFDALYPKPRTDRGNRRVVFDILFRTVAKTLRTIAAEALAGGAVAVAAGVIEGMLAPAALTGVHVPAEHGGAARLDVGHDLELSGVDVPFPALTERGAGAAEDLRHADALARHGGSGTQDREAREGVVEGLEHLELRSSEPGFCSQRNQAAKSANTRGFR